MKLESGITIGTMFKGERVVEELVDLTKYFYEPFDLPMCPICDQPIEEYQAYGLFKAWKNLLLAHVECICSVREKIGV